MESATFAQNFKFHLEFLAFCFVSIIKYFVCVCCQNEINEKKWTKKATSTVEYNYSDTIPSSSQRYSFVRKSGSYDRNSPVYITLYSYQLHFDFKCSIYIDKNVLNVLKEIFEMKFLDGDRSIEVIGGIPC